MLQKKAVLMFSNEVVWEQVVNELCISDAFHDAAASALSLGGPCGDIHLGHFKKTLIE